MSHQAVMGHEGAYFMDPKAKSEVHSTKVPR
jgi:hypothetical protein